MRRILVAIPVAVALGLVAETGWPPGIDPRIVLADLATGWVLIGCGLAAWSARRTPIATLLVLTGVAWFAGTLVPAAAFVHRGPLVHLLAASPTGRVRGRMLHGIVAAAYVVSAVPSVSRIDGVGVLVGLVVVVLAGRSLVGLRRRHGRSTLLSGLLGVAIGLALIVPSVARIAGTPIDAAGLVAYELALGGFALAVVAEILWRASAPGALTRIVVDLGGAAEAGTLRDRLARAVGDPSLLLGYAVEGVERSWVDDTGSPIERPAPTAERSVTPIAVGGRELGFVAHDPAFLGDPRAMALIASAAGLAISNSATQAEIRRRVADVDASRQRLVHAGDAQARHVESALENGALARLRRAAELLQAAAQGSADDGRLAEAILGLESSRDRLREFARGVYPGILRSGGLAAAIAELASHSPVPIETTVETNRRFDPVAESTLYFVCAEALANVAKHARAGRVRIGLAERMGGPEVTIEDDGVGGAAIESGVGLRGLADRLEALGGHLSLDSRPGLGTSLVARVPPRRPGLATAGQAE
jgi:hypothetical protein